MPKFLIEREIPGAGSLSVEQLQAIAQTSCGVLQKMGPQIQWVQSYVTGDTVYCVYIAPHEEMVREHARLLVVFRQTEFLRLPRSSIPQLLSVKRSPGVQARLEPTLETKN